MTRTLKAPPKTPCDDCPVNGACPIMPRGAMDCPDIAFVGEAGGGEEEQQGVPFVGRAGKLLRMTAQEAGLDLERIYYTNALMYRPEGNRDPKSFELEACSGRLLDELVRVRPKLIVTLGNFGTKALLGNGVGGILKVHGAYREIELDGVRMGILPAPHPAGIYRQPDLWLSLYDDLVRARLILEGHKPVIEPLYDDYLVIDRQSMFEALLRRLRQYDLATVDIETTSLIWSQGDILCVGFSWKRRTAAVLDWQALIKDNPDNLEALHEVLSEIDCTFQGGQFDNPWLWSRGVEPNWVLDTMLAHYTLDERQGTHGLKRQAIDRYWAPAYDDDLKALLRQARKDGLIPAIAKAKPKKGRLSGIFDDPSEDEIPEPTKKKLATRSEGEEDRKEGLEIPIQAWSVPHLRSAIMQYCGADADYQYRLTEDLPPEMDADEVTSVHDSILLPAAKHFSWLEYVGIRIDTEYHDQMGARWQQEQDAIVEELYDLSGSHAWPTTPSGRPWWASSKRLKAYLYGKESDGGIALRQMKGGWSHRQDGKLSQSDVLDEIAALEEDEIDAEAQDYWRTASSAVFSNMKPDSTATYMLYWLGAQHEFPRHLVQWRIRDKKLGTYYWGYKNIMREGGRIHPRARVHGARTGRISFTDPNVHGVARQKEIKRAWIADEGYLILYSDRSQAEIRMLAHLSGDEQLRRACEEEDIHAAISCDLFDMTMDQILALDPERREFIRRAAKTIAFGIIYGRMPDSLAPQLGCTVDEASLYRERFLAKMSQARQWIARQKATGIRNREVRSIYERKRRFPVILDKAHRSDIERQAVNTPVQGAVSDMTLEDNLKVIKECQRRGIKVLPWPHIHDGFMVQIERARMGEAVEIAKDVLAHPRFKTKVRFAVELKVGPNWAELETVHKG